jgi:protein-ribulosamine 3-kinase
LFGGFPAAFFESYNKNYPLFPGFSARSDVYNLYPLLVHVNLFGGGYLPQVVSILRQFV